MLSEKLTPDTIKRASNIAEEEQIPFLAALTTARLTLDDLNFIRNQYRTNDNSKIIDIIAHDLFCLNDAREQIFERLGSYITKVENLSDRSIINIINTALSYHDFEEIRKAIDIAIKLNKDVTPTVTYRDYYEAKKEVEGENPTFDNRKIHELVLEKLYKEVLMITEDDPRYNELKKIFN